MKPRSASSSVLCSSAVVRIAGVAVEVRELPWPDFLSTVQRVSEAISTVLNEKGRINHQRVFAAVDSLEDLISIVAEKSTGKSAEWISTLSLGDMLRLVSTVMDLNFTREVLSGERGRSSDSSIAKVIDYLVANGYSLDEVRGLSIRQLKVFTATLTERIRSENNAIRAASSRKRR